jgi:hypothetical protein
MARRWSRLAVAVAIAAAATHMRADVRAGVADRFRPLRSASASATSFLQNNWNRYQENYHPSYVLDENPETAWVEGVDGYGEGQSLTIPLSPLTSARALRLRIWNGYQKSKELFARNSMPRKIRVTVLDPTGGEVTSRDAELQQTWGAQIVVLDIPAKRGLSAVRITIGSVYPGTKYKDTCISDVLVDVDSEVPHNAAAENAKLAALKAWIEERKQTAAYFASKPAEYPFAFTHFSVSTQQAFDRAEFKRRFAEADALRTQLGPSRFNPVVKKPVRSAPDGLSFDIETLFLDIGDFLQLFSLGQVALFETNDTLSFHHRDDAGPGDYSEEWTTSLRGAYADGALKRIKLLAFERRFVATERTTSTSDRKLLLVYDDAGRLQRVYRESHEVPDYDYQWIRVSEIYSFSYDSAGKVAEVELLLYKNWLDNDAAKQEHDRKATRVVFTGAANVAKQAP